MSGDYRGESFEMATFAGARFRAVDFTDVKMVDVMLVNANLSGMIEGLVINGIDVAPLVDAEIRRLYPEREKFFGRDLKKLRTAWSTVCTRWDATIARAETMHASVWTQRVDGEWSVGETLRHLVFVIDAWIGRVVFGDPSPYHPLALPPTFATDLELGGGDPEPGEIIAAYRNRLGIVERWLNGLSNDDLDRTCRTPDTFGYPIAGEYPLIRCIWTLIDEWWWHRLFAERDLDLIDSGEA
jgi:hypothetical protein